VRVRNLNSTVTRLMKEGHSRRSAGKIAIEELVKDNLDFQQQIADLRTGKVSLKESEQQLKEFKSCHGRKRYASMQSATRAMHHLFDLWPSSIRSYACDECGGFHFGPRES
jgi:hypothetical protein